jgi:hypothetical protein
MWERRLAVVALWATLGGFAEDIDGRIFLRKKAELL